MNSGTALALALGGIATAEATGVTNFSGGEERVTPPQVPDAPGGGIDAGALVEAVSAAAQRPENDGGTDAGELAGALSRAMQSGVDAGRAAGGGGGGQTVVEIVQEAADVPAPDEGGDGDDDRRPDPRNWRDELPDDWSPETPDLPDRPDWLDGPDPTPNDEGGDASEYDLQTDYTGFLSEEVSGGAEALARAGDVFSGGASGLEDFSEENPYFASGATAGAAAGSVVPGVGNAAGVAAGGAVGGAAEIVADTVTGGTPLGVQSPINNDDDGAVWDGPDPLNLGRLTGDDKSSSSRRSSTAPSSSSSDEEKSVFDRVEEKFAGVATNNRGTGLVS